MCRNVKPIGRKRPVSQKQRQVVVQSLPSLTNLPTEVLCEILGIVLKDTLLESIQKQTPILGLRQYRALILTCKFFKAIVDTASLQVTIQCAQLLQQPG